jgi:hypothetical protein
MRFPVLLLVLVLVLSPRRASAEEVDPVGALAALVEKGEAGLAAWARTNAPESLVVLGALDARLDEGNGRAMVRRAFDAAAAGSRGALFEGPAPERIARLRAVAARLPDAARERLGVEFRMEGGAVVYFDARTFEDPKRLAVLEYLVASREQSYECLARMEPDVWAAFARAWSAERPIVLRWRDAEGGLTTVALKDVLPWVEKPRLYETSGLMIGGNHDERANRRLPPDDTPLRIGLVLE